MQAPAFTLKDQTGKEYSLADFSGKWLVLYFYPKDDTPGCTIEACSMRDASDELAELGAEVVGISKDDANSHDKFKVKYNLNFTLLSDPEHSTIEAYDAWSVTGTKRQTFIINPSGEIVKKFAKVTPQDHGQEVIESLKQLQA